MDNNPDIRPTINHNIPAVMHIDLNSCFATVCQQANIHLRGKPLVIAAYDSPRGCILSPSIEAKRYGVQTGMRVMEGRMLCKDIIVRTPDPPMVRDVHIKFKKIFQDYSDIVVPKSIDEAIIEFDLDYTKRSLVEVGQEIKLRLKKEIGEWISCSIGIGTNRFLAKTGASLKKPDGLETIDHNNLRNVYSRLKLTDLHGINKRYEARLNIHGIFTPLEFLDAHVNVLKERIFQSIVGYYWYQRLRGWETDAVEFERKSIGQDYALQKHTANPAELSRILMKLCEKMGRRLRRKKLMAKGIHIACLYNNRTYWHKGKLGTQELFTTIELYKYGQYVLNLRPDKTTKVAKLQVSCYALQNTDKVQETLFDFGEVKMRKAYHAVDAMNDKYGEFTVVPARMMGIDNLVPDRIAFGGVKELEEIYGA